MFVPLVFVASFVCIILFLKLDRSALIQEQRSRNCEFSTMFLLLYFI